MKGMRQLLGLRARGGARKRAGQSSSSSDTKTGLFTLQNLKRSVYTVGFGALSYGAYKGYRPDLFKQPTHVLRVERLEDKLHSYKATFVGEVFGPAALKVFKANRAPVDNRGLPQKDPLSPEAVLNLADFITFIGKDFLQKHAASKALKEAVVTQIIAKAMEAEDAEADGAQKQTTTAVQAKAEARLALIQAEAEAGAALMLARTYLDMQLLHFLLTKSVDEGARERFLQGDAKMVRAMHNVKNNLIGLLLEDGGDGTLLRTRIRNVMFGMGLPRVFVLEFRGDDMASQVQRLREEVTGLLEFAEPDRGDMVVVKLSSGGGTVTGYGLGAAQLVRLKDAGLHVTVCVDQVAASGGYLMAAVAHKVVASPFALLGSIGVVASMPNFSERMQREGVAVDDVTAGKYKRTMVPYRKATSGDRWKVQQDVDAVLGIFKAFLSTHRPSLDVDAVATGETWYGPQAKERGLVDELCTSDQYVLQQRRAGAEVFSVKLHKVPQSGLDMFSA
eukprot:CAMPEP_0173175826 /NCGR_PEP_ID=MMETSP1141-20130122/4121_1 /TAXON_ID=483371 /ORGANISM="non described non described, Strain CCMP2298" /LENGTH=503 /DNA_ID=CAMNT_0014098099 /DNA_START=46 /DNA_END=1554 /DNA_ORIENTATION=-